MAKEHNGNQNDYYIFFSQNKGNIIKFKLT